ncbi:unnamed protein product [Pylaiella littoralis]
MTERLSQEEAYELLGLEPDGDTEFTPDEIKKAYRKKSLATHPDKNPNDSEATAKFQQVGEAYMCLTDENYYAEGAMDGLRYDAPQEDSDGDEENFQWGGCRGGGSSGYRRGGMSPDDFMDLFSEIFCMGGMGGFGDCGPGGGIFMQRPPTFSRGGSEGGARGAFGWSGMVRGGMPFFCEEDSDDDDDFDESEYAPSGNASFRARLEVERQMKAEAREARKEAKKAAKAKRDKKQREEDEVFWKAQQERAQRRREQQAHKDKKRAEERELAQARREKVQEQQKWKDEQKVKEEAAAKEEEKRRRRAEVDSKREKAEALRARAFELCRAGKLSEFQSLLGDQDDVTSALAVKLSDRQDGKGKSGATLLHMCVSGADEIAQGQASDATVKGRLELANYLVQGVIQKDSGGGRDRVDVSKVDAQGLTVLHRAAREGDDALLDSLLRERTRSTSLKLETDLEGTCLEKGWTPLMHASSRGNVHAIDALLSAGSRVNQLSNPTVTGMVVAEQNALAICQDALKSSADVTEKHRLSKALDVLLAAVDKVETAKKAKEEEKRRKQEEEERKAQQSTGKQSLEQQLLEKKRRQLVERQRKAEEEEAEAARKKKEAEWEKKELAKIKREKKKEKREKEQKEAKERAFLKEQERYKAEYYRYGNSSGYSGNGSPPPLVDDSDQWEQWQTVTSAKSIALDKQEGERQAKAQAKLLQATQAGNTLSSLERYQQALQNNGYSHSSDDEDRAAAIGGSASGVSGYGFPTGNPARDGGGDGDGSSASGSGRPPRRGAAAAAAAAADGVRGRARTPSSQFQQQQQPPPPPPPVRTKGAGEGAAAGAAPYHGSAAAAGRGRGSGGGAYGGGPGSRGNVNSSSSSSNQSSARGGRGGGGGGGQKGARPPRSPGRGQTAVVSDGVDGWGLRGHPDSEGVTVKAIPLRARDGTETDGWNGSRAADSGWGDAPSASSSAAGKGPPAVSGWGDAPSSSSSPATATAVAANGSSGWGAGPSDSGNNSADTPRRPSAASSSSRGSVDWEERAELSRQNELGIARGGVSATAAAQQQSSAAAAAAPPPPPPPPPPQVPPPISSQQRQQQQQPQHNQPSLLPHQLNSNSQPPPRRRCSSSSNDTSSSSSSHRRRQALLPLKLGQAPLAVAAGASCLPLPHRGCRRRLTRTARSTCPIRRRRRRRRRRQRRLEFHLEWEASASA